MRFVDTNFLIRLIMHDQPDHVKQAEVALALSPARDLYILDAVLDEVCTILGLNHIYGMPRPLICDSVEQLLTHPAFQVSPVARATLHTFRLQPKLDFVDCLLLTQSQGQKERVLTFDKALLKALR